MTAGTWGQRPSGASGGEIRARGCLTWWSNGGPGQQVTTNPSPGAGGTDTPHCGSQGRARVSSGDSRGLDAAYTEWHSRPSPNRPLDTGGHHPEARPGVAGRMLALTGLRDVLPATAPVASLPAPRTVCPRRRHRRRPGAPSGASALRARCAAPSRSCWTGPADASSPCSPAPGSSPAAARASPCSG